MSERCSGEIESLPEFSLLAVEELVVNELLVGAFAGSMMSPKACDTIPTVDPALRLLGLTIGDCLTEGLELRGVWRAFLLGFLDMMTELDGAE